VAFLAGGEIVAYRRTGGFFRAKGVPGLAAYLGEKTQIR
jgi:hypothetical protein